MPLKCFEDAVIPDYLFKFAINANDLQDAIGIMPNSSVELSIVEEGEPLEGPALINIFLITTFN